MNSKSLLFCILFFAFTQFINAQKPTFFFTKGYNNISIITMGSLSAPHCTVIEYPDFLVIHEIPKIPESRTTDIINTNKNANPLIAFIDSVYTHKPIKYVLNSHSHGHSLSTIVPFLKQGASLVTTKESLEVYDKKGLFGNKTSKDYTKSIIEITSDTILLANTDNPIRVILLKKSVYKNIPTSTYLFFNFQKQKLLTASCMCSLKEFDKKKGYRGIVYSDRLLDVNKVIKDKQLDIENISQMYNFRYDNKVRKLPIYSVSYLRNVLRYGWSRIKLSEHFQQMSCEQLSVKKDSILHYLAENNIYSGIVNHAVYELIEKKEYQKAVALAQILVIYLPNKINYLDTLGEAYFNNGNMAMAKHYNRLIERAKTKTKEKFGLKQWEKNQKERLQKKLNFTQQ